MSKYSGSGWHKQSIRHSNARKYGKATPTKIDLKKYMGTWKQLSVEPTPFFQRGCKKVKAKNRLLPKGKVEVINTCDGKKIVGTARSVSPDNKKLKVSFFPPFEGDYNIVKLNPSYTRATIKGGKYKWELQKEKK